ncbi:MAG: class I SAM-dependent methyltransferase [Longimicrobiales bacterium]
MPEFDIRRKLRRVAFRIPGYRAMAQRILAHPSEISLEEGRFLGRLAQEVDENRCIIEIGTLFGSSTRVLTLFKPPTTRLITVDSFRWNPHGLARQDHARITREVLAEAIRFHNVQLCEMDKTHFYATYSGGPPGMVFLDANHSYESTRQDILWARKVGAAVICGHDYSSRFPGVVQAVEESGGAEIVVGTVFLLRLPRSTITGDQL